MSSQFGAKPVEEGLPIMVENNLGGPPNPACHLVVPSLNQRFKIKSEIVLITSKNRWFSVLHGGLIT